VVGGRVMSDDLQPVDDGHEHQFSRSYNRTKDPDTMVVHPCVVCGLERIDFVTETRGEDDD